MFSRRTREIGALLEPRVYSAPHSRDVGPEIREDVPPAWIDSCAENAEEVGLLRSLVFRSAMRTPLESGDSVLGSLTFLATDRAYNSSDLGVAVEVSRRSVAAIENARKYESALAEKAAASQASLGKDEVLAVLNHELRNLLAPIGGWARILLEHPAVRANRILAEGVGSLSRNAGHMGRIVDDCLELSCATRGKLRLDPDVVDLNRILIAAVEAVREAAWEKKQSLLVELSSSPLWIEADSARLQQVATNVLTNAVKYTERGGQLLVRSMPVEKTAGIEIADTGPGVNPGDLERIFEPFYQGDASLGGGLGLGLAISRQIVTLHRGRIWAESRGRGHGLSIHLRLPLAARENAPAIRSGQEASPRRVRRVLLVEDMPDVRVLMQIQMESMGHEVSAVADPLSAVAHLRGCVPDIVVSDIRMSQLDGFDLLRRMRSEPRTAAIPVLAVTGMSSRGDIARARKAGFAACLCKPVEPEELAEWIDRLTGRVA